MSDVNAGHRVDAKSSRLLRLIVGTLVVLALLIAAALYIRIGSWRMESACSLSDAQSQIHDSVGYGWSWQPLGFQCTYDDGETETSLWF